MLYSHERVFVDRLPREERAVYGAVQSSELVGPPKPKIVTLSRLYPKEHISLPPTTGAEMIVYANAEFPKWIDGDFSRWGACQKSNPTRNAEVKVLQLEANATLAEVFKVLRGGRRVPYLTQGQIIAFVRNHADKLNPQGWETLFPFEVKQCNEVFAAVVSGHVWDRQIRICRLTALRVWTAARKHRFVLPA